MKTRLFNLSQNSILALVVIASLLVWSMALPTLLLADDVSPGPVELQNILSDSAPGVTATHTISFKIATGTTETITDGVSITYHAAGASASSTSADDDFDLSGTLGVSATVDGTGAMDSTNSVSGQTITLDSITTPLAAGDVVTIVVSGIVNPNHTFADDDPLWATTHIVTAELDDSSDSGETYSSDTRVAIIDNVTMTAAVDTIFEFSVAGLTETDDINGRTLTGSTTPTSLDFGIIAHDNFYFLGHELTVETNASNGFVVTIQESQELTSSTGEIIHRFVDTESGLDGQADPIQWASPAGTLNEFETYGHYGITTEDETLNERTGFANDANFSATSTTDGGFVGNFHNEPRAIFGHTDAADGSTPNYGITRVGVGIEISSLQAAGDDYTNTLTYVATPTF